MKSLLNSQHWDRNIVFIAVGLITVSLLTGFFSIFEEPAVRATEKKIDISKIYRPSAEEGLFTIQDNTLVSLRNPTDPQPKIAREIKVIATAYSSTTWETDDTPFITASGNQVRDGIVANNLLPFGTKIRLPEIYGEKIFVVDDRMHPRIGYYHVDIWFPSHAEAKQFGAQRTYIEVLEG